MKLFNLLFAISIILTAEYIQYSSSELKILGHYSGLNRTPKNLATLDLVSKSQLDDMIFQLLNSLKANMSSGFPELGIPVLEPLDIKYIPVEMSDELVSLHGEIRNLNVIGLSTFNVTNVTSTMAKFAIDLEIGIPVLEISGEYDLHGRVADVLPVYGKGKFHANISQIVFAIGCKLKMRGGNGISLEEIHYQIQIGNISVDIAGLLGGGELGLTMNKILNVHGVKIFNMVEMKIHDKVVEKLKSHINKLLEGVKLSDILGSHNSIINTISQKPPSTLPEVPITRADASEYVDFALEYLREYMIYNGLDKIPLENQTVEFSEEFLWITWYGEAALYNGYLHGLETIHRSGPANLHAEENEEIVFDAELEVNDAGVKYDMLAQFMGLGPSATVIGNLESIKVFIKCRVSSGLTNVTLEEFDILDLGHLSVDIYGLGLLDFIAGLIADIIGNSVKHIVADMLENTIKSMLNEIIADLLIPVSESSNGNSTRKVGGHNQDYFHPYHRVFKGL